MKKKVVISSQKLKIAIKEQKCQHIRIPRKQSGYQAMQALFDEAKRQFGNPRIE